jgi:hypothetical protein
MSTGIAISLSLAFGLGSDHYGGPRLVVTKMQLLLHILLYFLLNFLALKHETQFLERAVVCLWEEEIHSCNLHQNPHAVNQIIFPSNLVQSDRVDIRIKKDGEPDRELLDSNALGALLVREYFYHVSICERVPANIIEPGRQKLAKCFATDGKVRTVSKHK